MYYFCDFLKNVFYHVPVFFSRGFIYFDYVLFSISFIEGEMIC